MTMAKRSVWTMTHGPDTVIADSEEDAWEVWGEHIGEDPDDYRAGDGWDRMDDRKTLEVGFESREDALQQLREAEAHGCDLDKAVLSVRFQGLQFMAWMHSPEHVSGQDYRVVIKAPASWWAQMPSGFLCSTEW